MSYTTNEFVTWLLHRSFGQGGAVALPSPGDHTVQIGDFPAGVNDVLNRLVYQYADWHPLHGSDVEWCFLVGGPGNGKSEALRALAGALRVDLPSRTKGQPAPRSVPPEWPLSAFPVKEGLDIVFINDASIPRTDTIGDQLGSLFLDLRDGINRILNGQSPVVLFGNVNRGILVEEQAALPSNTDADADRFASAIIRWLVNPPSSEPAPNAPSTEGVQTIVAIDPRNPYYGQFRVPISLKGAAFNILVHVVFLDVLSLLEPVPGRPGSSIDFSESPPGVAMYQPLGGFLDDGAHRDNTVAGGQIISFVDKTRWEAKNCISRGGSLCAAYSLCPFAQNARWLREKTLRERFLDMLRAAEIASARRLTYRDLLAHFSLAILGQPLEAWLIKEDKHPCTWVADTVRAKESGKTTAAVDLINQRIYVSLFPITDTITGEWTRIRPRPQETLYKSVLRRLVSETEASFTRPFQRAFSYIDPATDIESWGNTGTGSTIRSDVLDAIQALDIQLPSERVTQWTGIAAASGAIETLLDEALKDEITIELGSNPREASPRVNTLRKWRSILLLRQVGLALGQVSFKKALRAWLIEQENALRDGDPLELGKGIQALILPPVSTNQYFLAPLRPRIYNVDQDFPINTLFVSIPPSDLRVDVVPLGDTLSAVVRLVPRRSNLSIETIASLTIDLSIAREALLHLNGETQSFTEIGASAFARIERARASLVSRERMKNTTIYFTDAVGKLYRITSNPGSSVLLRVIPVKEAL